MYVARMCTTTIRGRDLHLPPFLGEIDWARQMALLKQGGYTGKLSFEMVYGVFPEALLPIVAAKPARYGVKHSSHVCGHIVFIRGKFKRNAGGIGIMANTAEISGIPAKQVFHAFRISAAVLMPYISMNCPMMFRFSSPRPLFLFLPIPYLLCRLYFITLHPFYKKV